MKIGVTGTRSGMNEKQKEQITEWLTLNFKAGDEFHHGDCVGVDAETAAIAKLIGYRIYSHPPTNQKNAANFASDVILPRYTYHTRNRHIVDTSDFLLVVPKEDERQGYSGTWYTYEYGIKQHRDLKVFTQPSPEKI